MPLQPSTLFDDEHEEFRAAVEEFGPDPVRLAARFGVYVSAAGLRLGEATGVSVALLANDRIYARGRPYAWPTSPFQLLALASCPPPGVRAAHVTQAAGKLGLDQLRQ